MEVELPALHLIVQRLIEDECLFFIGAGVSNADAAVPTGGALAKSLCLALSCSYKNELLQEIAEEFEETFDRPALLDHLKSRLDIRFSDSDLKKCKSLNLLADLPCRVIVTTNYDTLIEQVWEMRKIPIDVLRNDFDIPSWREVKPKLLKIHGDFLSHPNSLVITNRDYANYKKSHPLMIDKLRDLFMSKTTVFLGYSLRDPDFWRTYHSVLAKTRQLKRKSYVILREPRLPSDVSDLKRAKIEPLIISVPEFMREIKRSYRFALAVSRGQAMVLPAVLPPSQRPSFKKESSFNVLRKIFRYEVQKRINLLNLSQYRISISVDCFQNFRGRKRLSRLEHRILDFSDDLTASLKRSGYIVYNWARSKRFLPEQRAAFVEFVDIPLLIFFRPKYELQFDAIYGRYVDRRKFFVLIHKNLTKRLSRDMRFIAMSQADALIQSFLTSECFLDSLLPRMMPFIRAQGLKRIEAELLADLGVKIDNLEQETPCVLYWTYLAVLAFLSSLETIDPQWVMGFIGAGPEKLFRHLKVLEARGLIVSSGDRYQLTAFGQRLMQVLGLASFNFAKPSYSSRIRLSIGRLRTRRIRQLDPQEMYFPSVGK